MQDTDGKVWADCGAGVSGDSSDDHWTDNQVGTSDDRHIHTAKRSRTAAIFAVLQGLAAQCYAPADRAYAEQCLAAGPFAGIVFPGNNFLQLVGWRWILKRQVELQARRP